MKTYRLGTRKSALARTQSTQVQEQLKALGIDCELIFIESLGDENHKEALYNIENVTPGLFTKQLETALLNREIDLAVHSLKDLPTVQPAPLLLAAVTKRVVTEDVLLVHPEAFDPTLALHLRKNSIVGSSSLRREAQLLKLRPDLKVVTLRGNVPTRVQAVRERKMDATVLAAAGIDRLKLDLGIVQAVRLAESEFPPAPGQGALAIETRQDAERALLEALAHLHDAQSARETRVERGVLKGLFGGCTLPLGVRCYDDGKMLKIKAFIGVLKPEEGTDISLRQWHSMHYFDISGLDEETLVAESITHLKRFLDEGRNA